MVPIMIVVALAVLVKSFLSFLYRSYQLFPDHSLIVRREYYKLCDFLRVLTEDDASCEMMELNWRSFLCHFVKHFLDL